MYNTVNNICGNQIQLSVFSMKILAGKGNHRETPANAFYKPKYFACVNTLFLYFSFQAHPVVLPLFLHLEKLDFFFSVFLMAVQAARS